MLICDSRSITLSPKEINFVPVRKANGIVKNNLCQIINENSAKICNFVRRVSLLKKNNYEIKDSIIVSNNFNVQCRIGSNAKTG